MKVPYSVLAGIQSALSDARSEVEATSAGAPGTVDAGDMGPLATDLVALLAGSAAGLSEGLGGAATMVADRMADYRTTDDQIAVGFGRPGPS